MEYYSKIAYTFRLFFIYFYVYVVCKHSSITIQSKHHYLDIICYTVNININNVVKTQQNIIKTVNNIRIMININIERMVIQMLKGKRNTRFRDVDDIHKAYSKLYNRVDNGDIDDKTARLLLSILNGMSNSYKILQLEQDCEELMALVQELKGED